jgi:hypothetical protein
LAKYIEAGPSAPPWAAAVKEVENPELEDSPEHARIVVPDTKASSEPLSTNDFVTPSVVVRTQPQDLRVFISHGSNMEIVDQVQTMLQMADIQDEVAVKEETAAIPIPEKVFGAMRRCQAGIIIVSVDETRKNDTGGYVINENVLIEIGAAFVLYDKKVVLVWDKRLTVPSNLQGLYRCEFEGNELSWSSGMKLMKAIRGFKNSEPS